MFQRRIKTQKMILFQIIYVFGTGPDEPRSISVGMSSVQTDAI